MKSIFAILALSLVIIGCGGVTDSTYVVNFDLNGGGGTPPLAVSVDSGDRVDKPSPDPNKTDSTFENWYHDNDVYDFNSPVVDNIELMAHWDINAYTVSFDLAGGDGPALADLYPNHGDTINKPIPDPSKSGEDFVDWYLGGSPYDFSSPVTGNINLVALWSATSYTVSFDLAGGDGPALADLYPNHGDTINKPIPDPSKSGEDFVDWYLGGSPYDFSSPVISDISLVAQWNSKVYTVSFDLDGGDGPALADLYPNHGDTINKPIPDPSKSGEDFVDWYLGGSPYDFSSPVTGNINLVAQWIIKGYIVNFDLAGGDVPAPADLYPNHGDTISRPIPDPIKTGNALFNDWYLGGSPYDFSSPVTGDISLVAGWNFTLSFDLNGGSGRLPDDILVLENNPGTAPSLNPIKNNDVFDFWSTDAGGASPYTFVDPVLDDVLLYAQWTGVDGEDVSWEYDEAENRIRITGLNNLGATTLIIPESINGIVVEVITNGAFQNETGLKGDLIIPDSVTTIEANAFEGSGFDGNLTLGAGLESIGDSAFRDVLFTGDLIIPDSVSTIEKSAFRAGGFTGNLVISSSVISIENDTFSKIPFMGTLSMGNQVEDIGRKAFSGTGFSGELLIPATVTSIGMNAFEDTNFNSASGLPLIAPSTGKDLFKNTSNLTSIHVRIGATGYGAVWEDLTVIEDLP